MVMMRMNKMTIYCCLFLLLLMMVVVTMMMMLTTMATMKMTMTILSYTKKAKTPTTLFQKLSTEGLFTILVLSVDQGCKQSY